MRFLAFPWTPEGKTVGNPVTEEFFMFQSGQRNTTGRSTKEAAACPFPVAADLTAARIKKMAGTFGADQGIEVRVYKKTGDNPTTWDSGTLILAIGGSSSHNTDDDTYAGTMSFVKGDVACLGVKSVGTGTGITDYSGLVMEFDCDAGQILWANFGSARTSNTNVSLSGLGSQSGDNNSYLMMAAGTLQNFVIWCQNQPGVPASGKGWDQRIYHFDDEDDLGYSNTLVNSNLREDANIAHDDTSTLTVIAPGWHAYQRVQAINSPASSNWTTGMVFAPDTDGEACYCSTWNDSETTDAMRMIFGGSPGTWSGTASAGYSNLIPSDNWRVDNLAILQLTKTAKLTGSNVWGGTVHVNDTDTSITCELDATTNTYYATDAVNTVDVDAADSHFGFTSHYSGTPEDLNRTGVACRITDLDAGGTAGLPADLLKSNLIRSALLKGLAR